MLLHLRDLPNTTGPTFHFFSDSVILPSSSTTTRTPTRTPVFDTSSASFFRSNLSLFQTSNVSIHPLLLRNTSSCVILAQSLSSVALLSFFSLYPSLSFLLSVFLTLSSPPETVLPKTPSLVSLASK